MLVVVGGHSRNLGKTALVAGLIRRLRSRRWTAVKITQYGHGICSRNGSECECSAGSEHPIALSEEYEPNRTDSGRFLAAGAERSFWLRTPMGQLPQADETLRKIFASAENVIVESNSVLELVQPDVFLMMLNFACQDFKPSSLRYIDRADAFVMIDRGMNESLCKTVAAGKWELKPHFLVKPPQYVTAEIAAFVDGRPGCKPLIS
jgi:molybdopterin-guanine dinucleotide biosynthesis protein